MGNDHSKDSKFVIPPPSTTYWDSDTDYVEAEASGPVEVSVQAVETGPESDSEPESPRCEPELEPEPEPEPGPELKVSPKESATTEALLKALTELAGQKVVVNVNLKYVRCADCRKKKSGPFAIPPPN